MKGQTRKDIPRDYIIIKNEDGRDSIDKEIVLGTDT